MAHILGTTVPNHLLRLKLIISKFYIVELKGLEKDIISQLITKETPREKKQNMIEYNLCGLRATIHHCRDPLP